ncbi:oxidase cueO precursor [Boeremia exigua]|uniref:oxidase cueO precursor n=1 Tax=Boeremia exigua TaxID=749465 RepID=UPI001E8D8C52|nr:oxidase cueO precursor [Boeremia exigua]KAH6638234.1 oxidase cueO precursor [Boeremia exigua]
MRQSLFLGVTAFFTSGVFAGDKDWLSPEYKQIFQNPLPFPPEKSPRYSYTNKTTGNTIDYYEIDVKPFEHQVYPGLKPARLVGYDGVSPGPTIRTQKGRETVVRFMNNGDKDLSVHLHGSYSRAPFDGWAEDVTKPKQYKDYYYPNHQSARTLWYHDHAVHHTAENAYFGQAGFYILEDPAEAKLGLPSGPKYDLPLALSAKQYNPDGTLFDPVNERDSLFGDVIHVNGQPWPYHKVEARKYRLRFLDASISRAFKLTFEADGKAIPFHVIAADTGLLTKPVQTSNLEISMAERWEVVFDFGPYAGKNVTLKNGRDVQHDEDYAATDKVMQFVVGTGAPDTTNNGPLPGTLRTVPFPPKKNGVDRTFKFGKSGGAWTVNGVTFADVNNRILAKPQRGAIEVWELENSSGGWSHPVHIHLVDFQILSRTGGKRPVLNYEKEALKDVVLLGENEKVTVIARYAPYDGVYMFHCHNLIHEDHDMMAAFNVTSLSDWGYPETTKFLDPMEEKYRSKAISAEDSQEAFIMDKMSKFEAMEAYSNVEKLEEALEDYRINGPPKTLSTVVVSSTSSTATAVPTTTGKSAPAVAATTARSSSTITSAAKVASSSSTSTKKSSSTKAATSSTRRR